MSVKLVTATFTGVQGHIVKVEVDIERGLPCFNIVGLADTSIKESKERVRAAIVNSGFEFPISRIIINLAPADIKKVGALFDLPIALGILMASDQISFNDSEEFLIMGELSLSGELKGVKGAMPVTIEGLNNGIEKYIVPFNNSEECAVVKGTKIYGFEDLKEVVGYIKYRDLMPYEAKYVSKCDEKVLDFKDVLGQESCKRALEVAAAGNHNIIMVGPPGSGKTMLAERIPSILPPLSYEEALEVTKIYSVSGNLKEGEGLKKERPFRSPHHTASYVSLVGGGNNLVPGEISLAHNGVLFLDEMPEFKKAVLEVLRQPLEDRKIKISRASGTVTYPANIMLIAAMNPCYCGKFLSKRHCTCSDYEKRRYISKLSAPLLDRIDLFCFVKELCYSDIKARKKSETSVTIRKRIEKARQLQKKRFKEKGIYYNSEMSNDLIQKYCKLSKKGDKILERIYNKYNLSTRAYNRILKVSRTIADLDNSKAIKEQHIIEAIQYRKFLNEEII